MAEPREDLWRVRVPGTWIVGLPDKEAFETSILVRAMEGALIDAHICLELFRLTSATISMDPVEKRKPFVHARGFLFALDMVGKLLRELSEIEGTPAGLRDTLSSFRKDFPDLKGVRNSIAHTEQRLRSRSRHGKITPKAISTSGIHAPTGAMVTDHLYGDVYGCTSEMGELAQVAVNETSLVTARRHVQAAVDTLQWKGPFGQIGDGTPAGWAEP